MEWTIEDHTNPTKGGGYFRILRDGKRVADIFPYAVGEDFGRIMADARYLVDCANREIEIAR